jgi:regulator of replication initiation timing
MVRQTSSSLNSSQQLGANLTSSLHRLKEKENYTLNSRKALVKQNETLRERLASLESKLQNMTSSRPQPQPQNQQQQLSRPHTTTLISQGVSSLNLLNLPSPAGLQLPQSMEAALGLIANIPKPLDVSTQAHLARLQEQMDKLPITNMLGRHPQTVMSRMVSDPSKTILDLSRRGYTKTKTFFEANKAIIFRIAIIILVLSIAPMALPLLGL